MPAVITYPGVFGVYSPITFTRASSATYFDSTGTLQTAASNAPRLDYNPSTLAARGFLVEESRTNSIRNNTMQGAVAGTPGTLPTNWSVSSSVGLTTNVIGTGTSNGITYIDLQVTGTTTGTAYVLVPEVATQIAATNGQTWTSSAWWSVVAGDLTNVTAAFFDIRELDSGGVQLTSGGISVASPTSTFTRITASRATSNVATAFVQPRFRFTVTNSASVNFTIRIGLPQLELGAFATSVIPTTTAAVTRSADVASVDTLSPWFNATEGTLFAEFVLEGVKSATGQVWVQFDDGTTSNRIINSAGSANTIQMLTVSGGTADGSVTTPATTYAANTTYKTAFAVKANDLQAAVNGTAGSVDSSATMPVGLTNLKFGASLTATSNIWFRRVTYYPSRLSDSQLQTITA